MGDGLPVHGDPRVARVVRVLEGAAARELIGEPVSQLDHALQAAALARGAGAPDSEVLAALLHDVGHLCAPPDVARMEGMEDLGVVGHEHWGADFLALLGFRPDVTALVRGHVAAKRYLVAVRPEYARSLSAASLQALAHQGGPMSADERRAFEADPLYAAKLRLRSWDEGAKRAGRRVPVLSHYVPLLAEHLDGSSGPFSKAASTSPVDPPS